MNVTLAKAEHERAVYTESLRKQGEFLAHLQSSVSHYPKIVQSRYMKKGRSDTPLS